MKINTKSLRAIIKEELKALQQKKLISESGLHPEHPAMKAITEAFKIFRKSRPEDKGSIKQAMRDVLSMMERSTLQESGTSDRHIEIQNDVEALIQKHGIDLESLVAVIGDMDTDTEAAGFPKISDFGATPEQIANLREDSTKNMPKDRIRRDVKAAGEEMPKDKDGEIDWKKADEMAADYRRSNPGSRLAKQ